MNRRLTTLLLCTVLMLGFASGQAVADRLKDLTSIAGVRTNQLVGYGVVVGLAGTGDEYLASRYNRYNRWYHSSVL